MQINDYESAVNYIEDFTWSTTRLGLFRTKELLERLGNPQEKLSFIHVAGSNGKGSVCAMLASVLKEAGLTVGLYTSPYLIDFREQLQINGAYIEKDELVETVRLVAPKADAMEDHPSRFELLTACAFVYFLKHQCDIVVLEVGMGGALDSTNIIPPAKVSVITNIGLEHCEYLGNTIEEIAATKGGIIKQNTTCVLYKGDPRVRDVIGEICKKENVLLHTVGDVSDVVSIGVYDQTDIEEIILNLPLMGNHQRKNAYVALAVLSVLFKQGIPLDVDVLKRGFLQVSWPGRFQILSKSPLFILDGAHNPQCTRALFDTLSEYYSKTRFIFLIGFLADKDYASILETMLVYAKEALCITPENERALLAKDLVKAIDGRVPAKAYESISEALFQSFLTSLSGKEMTPILAFGSLYTAGSILRDYTRILKKAQREICLKKRRALSAFQREADSKRIVEALISMEQIQSAKTILSYYPIRDEVDVSRLHEWALREEKTICFPCVGPNHSMEAYAPHVERLDEKYSKKASFVKDAFSIDTYGIPSPRPSQAAPVAPEQIDVVLVPCVGFDKRGNRIGYGGGYYDRFLPRVKEATPIVVAFEEQCLDEVATEDTDRCIPLIVTQTTIYSVK